MSWYLFDEHGERVQWFSVGWVESTFVALPGRRVIDNLVPSLGFDPERSWSPSWFAAKMARGYRVFSLDVGRHEWVDDTHINAWWQPHVGKRLPTLAAVEMYLRHTA